MAIWCLYTECLSEPSFHGYTTSKRKAKEWMRDEQRVGYDFGDKKQTINDMGDRMYIEVSDAHYIHAVKLNKLEGE